MGTSGNQLSVISRQSSAVSCRFVILSEALERTVQGEAKNLGSCSLTA
jgi:hypothetical protein